jgi:hypothetical protein
MFPLGPLPVGTGTRSVFATGGLVQDIGGYRIHTFGVSGTFAIKSGGPVDTDWLIVAGGGGGGQSNSTSATAGGGGAGGYREGTQSLATNSYAVTVGAGGAGGAAEAAYGSNGGNSAVATIIGCTGGGGGVYCWWNGVNYYSSSGYAGGSGGGVGFYDGSGYVGGAGTAGEGFAGGSGKGGGSGSGGGGAGSAGAAGTAGTGKTSSISGTLITYATGGRHAGPQTYYYGTGGFGGYGAYQYAGGPGNGGLVILRYKYTPSASAGGNDDYTNLLLHFDSTINDASGYANSVTNGFRRQARAPAFYTSPVSLLFNHLEREISPLISGFASTRLRTAPCMMDAHRAGKLSRAFI